jgi:recombination protein RecA
MSGPNEQRASLELELDADQKALEASLNPSQPQEIEVPSVPANMNLPFALSEAQKAKFKSMELAIAGIDKDFGKGMIIRLDQNDVLEHAEFMPTGIMSIDSVLGGGFARSRIYELYGPEGSGKTSLALKAAAAAQKAGGIAAIIDVEHAFEPMRAMQLGVNPAALYLSQPDYGEQALAICETLAQTGSIDVIIVDSVAALTPKAEYEGDMGDASMGLQARMMGQAMRKMKAKVRIGRSCVIFINQIREKIGMMFGNPETTPGGRALKFFADVRLDIRRGEMLKFNDTVFGQKCVVQAVKNKLAPPYVKAEYSLYYDNRGIDELESIIDLARSKNIIEQKGSWFSITMNAPMQLAKWKGLNLSQGQLQIRDALNGDKELLDALIAYLTEISIKRRQSMLETLSQQHSMGMIGNQAHIDDDEEPKKRGRGRPKKEKE